MRIAASIQGVLLALLLVACSDAPRHETLPEGSVVLAFGDSVTHGTGAPEGADYPRHLAALSGWQVINAGVPGDTAQAARERLPGLLRVHQPQLVIVELGGNDFLRKRPDHAVEADLRAILAQVAEHGALPVLVAVPRLSLLRASVGALNDASLYADLAQETGVLLVPDVFSEILSDAELRADAIHPNAAGYRVLAEGIARALRESGLLE
ncbi:MAG: arylesterase [Haliea sp.]|nr:arylesterase [Haliea sp.]|tara:strand:- start:21 stop:650 length:630 start_codon:yes stop_codon:yes gene_type:complete